jgi:DedD protein
MDRRVKERLIGASILVAIVVLVVPELLSGPKPATAPPAPNAIAAEPIRTVTVDLATSKAPAASEAEPPVAVPPPAGGTAPGAQSGNPGPSASAAAAAAPNTAASPAAAAPVETPAPSPISAARWAVQLGSFANRANADNLVHQLKAQGLTAFVSSGGSGQSLRYRVRMGRRQSSNPWGMFPPSWPRGRDLTLADGFHNGTGGAPVEYALRLRGPKSTTVGGRLADVFILLIVLGSTLIGVLRGFVREAVSVAFWILAIWLSWKLGPAIEPHLGGLLADPNVAPWAGRLVILVIVLLLGWIVGMLLG